MDNPFEQFSNELKDIKSLLLEIKNSPKPETKPENYTVKEAAPLLKVSEQSIHNYIKKGLLGAKKVGRIYLIPSSEIEAALQDVKSLKYKRA